MLYSMQLFNKMEFLYYFLLLIAALLFIAIIIGLFFLIVIVKGAPFIPTNKKKIGAILDLAEIGSGQKALDLGSGDGRLVMALAKAGIETHGYEINPFLVWWSRYKVKRAGLTGKAFIIRQDFFQADLSNFDLIVFFGAGHIMDKLEAKLKNELPTGARVISNGFIFNNWTHSKKIGQLYLYQK